MGCKSVVTPTAAVSHHHKPPAAAISHHRKPAKLRVDRNVLQALVDEGSIQSGWPTVTPGDVEYQGLERKWGAACPQEGCSLMFTNKKHAIAHALDIHKLAVDSVDVGWMQRLSQQAANNHSWFPVIPRSAYLPGPSANYLLALRQELDARPPIPAAERDHRHISPWHVTTRWMQYMEGKDPQVMLNLIELPKDGQPFFYLIACVRNYIDKVYQYIPTTSEVCLQILNTDTDNR